MMHPELGLIDDKLLENFNAIRNLSLLTVSPHNH